MKSHHFKARAALRIESNRADTQVKELDGFGSHNGNWGRYWGKQGPEFLDHRLALYDQEQRMVFRGHHVSGVR